MEIEGEKRLGARSASTVGLLTARLRLRELTGADLDFVASMLGDPQVMRHYPWVLDREGARCWIERQRERYARDGHGLWLVETREGAAPVGQVGPVVQHVDGEKATEVTYLLHRAYWGRGLATEAAAVRDHAFHELGADHVIALVRPVNAASRAVAMRLGMRATARTMRHGFEHDVFRVARPRAAR